MKYIVPFFYILGLFMMSCTSIRYISIQALEPPQITLPIKSNDIIIIKSKAKLQLSEYVKNKDNKDFPFEDSLVKSLKTILNESPLFKNANINVYEYNDWQIARLSTGKSYLILNIDSMDYKFSSSIISESSFLSEFGEFEARIYNLYFFTKLNIRSLKISNLDSFQYGSVISKSLSDTIQLDSYNINQIKKVFGDIGASEGFGYGQWMVPYWMELDRSIYYSSNSNMLSGYREFSNGNFSFAIKYWEKIYAGKKGKLAFMAAFNTALAYEFMDDINSSEEWILKAEEIKSNKNSKDYLTDIKKRIKDKILLDNILQ